MQAMSYFARVTKHAHEDSSGDDRHIDHKPVDRRLCQHANLSLPREVIEAKFDAVNRHALADVVARYAPDAQITASNFCAPRQGRADVERIYRGIFSALPDVVADIQEYIVEGDRVVVRFVVRSRTAGAHFQIPIINVFTVRDGLIVRDEGRFDSGGRPCL
jgi:ketosteroid isomerase-like protein